MLSRGADRGKRLARQPTRRFLFRLALALGTTVGELGERLSAEELRDWMAFDALEPIGHRREDLNAGLIASTIANVNRGRGARVLRPADFMIDFDGRLDDARKARAAADMRAFFERHNERIRHGHERR